ncbi:MAG: molybdenum ABC transporter ATP-binding protein [Spirochaetes bacterium]|nr:molybdenum ABC transporter ATP-binding protein [Spirochaetota bacterium]
MDLTMGVYKEFGAFKLDADFEITGDRIGLFGPSGSGKTTLVGILAGLHSPDEGAIHLDGETLFDSRKGIRVPIPKRRIGIVFQRSNLFPHMSVKRNLLYGYRRCPPESRTIKMDTLLAVLQIEHLLHREVGNLSGGERRRVAIGRALLSNPRLLIMDEPLSGLDDSLKFQIIPFLRSACETFGIPYIFISHSLIETRLMTEQVLTVDRGFISGQMTAEELARAHMGDHSAHYMNLLKAGLPRHHHGLYVYDWSGRQLLISDGDDRPESLFELSSAEIILCKRHPQAISARNLLPCMVTDVFETGGRLGVELAFGKERLIAEIVRKAADDLGIRRGAKIYAAIKATAFRRLG